MARLRALTALLATSALGGLVWACSLGETPAAGASPEVTGAEAYPLGTCELPAMPEDLSAAVPFEPVGALYRFEPQPWPERKEQVLTKVALSARRVVTDGGHSTLSITAEVAQGDVPGSVSFVTGISSAEDAVLLGWQKYFHADGGVSEEQGRSYERRTFLALEPSELVLGRAKHAVDVVAFHWESSGEQWMLLGRRHRGGRTDLVAAAARCAFDVTGWKLLRDAACAGELYDESGAPLPTPEPREKCHRAPEDTFDVFRRSLDAGYIVDPAFQPGSVDAGEASPPPPPTPTPPSPNDGGASTPDAGATADPPPPPPPPADPEDEEPVDDAGGGEGTDPPSPPLGEDLPESAPPAGPQPKSKKAAARETGCAFAPGSAPDAPLAVAGVVAALLARRRRRPRADRR